MDIRDILEILGCHACFVDKRRVDPRWRNVDRRVFPVIVIEERIVAGWCPAPFGLVSLDRVRCRQPFVAGAATSCSATVERQ